MATATKSKVKVGEILSETSFFVVQQVGVSGVTVNDDLGNTLNISHEYVDKILNSADNYTSEENRTTTQLADIFINNPRVAMTVAFYKKDTPKTKTALKKEKEAMVARFQEARVSDIAGLVEEFINNPITATIPGELRIMKGRHYGNMDDLGRIQFVDMEAARGTGEHDGRNRQVDPRTITYVIVNGVKYNLK